MSVPNKMYKVEQGEDDTDVKVKEVEKFVLYIKLSYACILIGSHL